MFYSSVLCCLLLLLLSIVQATATTCPQQGTQDCDQKLLTLACNGLGTSDPILPISCPRPPTSCLNLHLNNQSAPSGIYQIQLSNGTMVDAYCDMEGTNCNGERGWTRVAFVNMSQPGATCPTGLTQIKQSNLTLCSHNETNVASTFFTTLELSYTAVCGRVTGYQFGSPIAFPSSITDATIDDVYVSGVSITHGTSSREHIWSYAAGLDEDDTSVDSCPCNEGDTMSTAPSYVGDNYYCESSTNVPQRRMRIFYSDDPLWDGMQCDNLEGPCCTNGRLPWFSTTLPEATSDDIELRLMTESEVIPETSIPIDLIELYIR